MAGFGQRDEGEAAKAERAALAVDDEPLHPVAGAGRLDVQVESVAVTVSAGLGDAAAEGGREGVAGMWAAGFGLSRALGGSFHYDSWMLAWIVIVAPASLVENFVLPNPDSPDNEFALKVPLLTSGLAAYALGGIMATLNHLDGDASANPRLHRVTPPPSDRRDAP